MKTISDLFNSDKKYIVSCDLETTSLDVHSGDWIVGSFGLLDLKSLVTVSELELTSRPRTWSKEAEEIHGITLEEAQKFPKRSQSMGVLLDWLPDANDFVFCCHARTQTEIGFLHFDFAFIKMDFFLLYNSLCEFYNHMKDEFVISTQNIGKDLKKRKLLDVESMKLDVLSAYFKIKLLHHNAESDRKAMEQILREFYAIDQRTNRIGDTELDNGTSSSQGNLLLEK